MNTWLRLKFQAFFFIWSPFWFISFFESTIWNSQNYSMFHLAFVAGPLQAHWWGFVSRNYVVWPILFLTNVFIALKGTHFFIFISFLTKTYFITSDTHIRKIRLRTDVTAELFKNKNCSVGNLFKYSSSLSDILSVLLSVAPKRYFSIWIGTLYFADRRSSMSAWRRFVSVHGKTNETAQMYKLICLHKANFFI